MELDDVSRIEPDSTVMLDEQKLEEVLSDDSLNFDEWTSLISVVESTYKDDIEKIGLVYDSFLSRFPHCYGYWTKYAAHKMRLCAVDEVVEVFERAVQSASYSVNLWADYCSFASLVFKNPSDVCRLFERGLSFVGKDYLCYTLWDKYITFEFSQQDWSSLAHLYVQALRFPSKKLSCYYDSFMKLVRVLEEKMKVDSASTFEMPLERAHEGEFSKYHMQKEVSSVIKDLLDPSIGLARLKALQKYKFIGEQLYQESLQLNEKINCFEVRIKRPYFHMKPLDVVQLENWHKYLDFAELHGDFDWAVKLYERCLIPCANYPEFWMRYVEFVESKGGREIARFTLNRATQVFLKRVSVNHLFNARFMEYLGDLAGARAAYKQCETESDADFVEVVVTKANMEKRMGNLLAASNIYKAALETAAKKQQLHVLPTLYIHFSRLKYMITDNEEVAIEILLEGIKHVPNCKVIIEELINFAMTHRGPSRISMVGSVVVNAMSPGAGTSQGLSAEDRQDISRLYLKFVDLCGTLSDLRMAWKQHIGFFPHLVRTTALWLPTCTRQWKMATDSPQVTLANSDCSIQPSMEDEKPLFHENDKIQTARPATDLVPEEMSLLAGNEHVVLDPVPSQKLLSVSTIPSVDLIQSEEPGNIMSQRVSLESFNVSEPPRECASEPSGPLDSACQIIMEATSARAEENEIQEEIEIEVQLGVNTPPLERPSLDPLETRSMQDTKGSQDNSISNRSIAGSDQDGHDHFASHTVSIQPCASNEIHIGNASPSTSPNRMNHLTRTNVGRNQRQNSNSYRFHIDSKFGLHETSNRRFHHRQGHQRGRYQQSERSSQFPASEGPSCQPSTAQQGTVPTNSTVPQAWSMQTVQHQNLFSPYQVQPQTQPSTYSEAQMQQQQAYTQMWQFYYYQQQQQQYSQQEQQQPQQQQLLQTPDFQQQQSQQPQQQVQMQQLPQLQPFQLQQLLQAQQSYQQQNLFYLQQQQQQQQLQLQQGQQYQQQQHDEGQGQPKQGQTAKLDGSGESSTAPDKQQSP